MRGNGNGFAPHTKEAKEAHDRIQQYDSDVKEGLQKFHSRTHWEATEEKTPLDALLASEEAPRCPHCKEQIAEGFDLEAWGIRNATIRRMFEYFAQDGISPMDVMRNVYAVAAHMGIEPFGLLNLRERTLLLDDSHGGEHFRTEQLCTNKLRREGAHNWKAPGQKSLKARQKCSAAQKNNTNRKRKQKSRHKRLTLIQQKQK